MYHEKAITVVDVNQCDSNPCQNDGTCEDKFQAFECTCAACYEGDTCGAYSYQYYMQLENKSYTYSFIGEQIISKYVLCENC